MSEPIVSQAKKFDDAKLPLSLLPFEALESTADVLRYGAQKYAAHNWRKGMQWSRLISALLRHLFAWIKGETHDPESGLPHLAHAACCLMFLQSYEINSLGQDDRWRKEP